MITDLIHYQIKNQYGKVIAIGQCKAWISSITVKEVREFFGVMASEKMAHGYYFATSTFTKEAIKFFSFPRSGDCESIIKNDQNRHKTAKNLL
ncbi:MAG: restriction endonuclease [Methylococcales bacterium]|nr:restriction endonuclease [Methylococcales bacterium]